MIFNKEKEHTQSNVMSHGNFYRTPAYVLQLMSLTETEYIIDWSFSCDHSSTDNDIQTIKSAIFKHGLSYNGETSFAHMQTF